MLRCVWVRVSTASLSDTMRRHPDNTEQPFYFTTFKSCLCFDSSTSISIDHDSYQYSITSTSLPSQQPRLSFAQTPTDTVADLEASLETSILAFKAANCDVIQLNLKEFVFGLVALYLGGALVGAIDIFVALCIWRQEDGRDAGERGNG